MPTPKIDWNGQADFYSKFAFCELDDTRVFLDAIDIQESDTVLDVCCGPGRVSVLAAERGARVTGVDAASKMLEHARENAKMMGVEDRCNFRLLDWNHVMPGQNLEKHDIVIASRCMAIMDVEKLSKLANKRVAVQIFANAPSIPMLLDVIFSGCGRPDIPAGGPGMPPAPGPGGPGMPPMPGPGGPGRAPVAFMVPNGRMDGPGAKKAIYLTIAEKAFQAGYDPNVRIFPERFRRTFADEKEALEWVCSLREDRAAGNEERVAINIRPFLTPVDDGVEFCIATKASIIWWDV